MHYLCLCICERCITLVVRNTILPMACKMENLVEYEESIYVHFYHFLASFFNCMMPNPFALVSLEPHKTLSQ